MAMPPLADLVPVLQTAIGPVILISGVGLLLLSMTNRLGRVIDRARILRDMINSQDASRRERALAQLPVLWDRASLIRKSIMFATISALIAALMIISLFIGAIFSLDFAWFIALLFVGCMLALIWSLAFFLKDINRALLALKLELGDMPGDAGGGK